MAGRGELCGARRATTTLVPAGRTDRDVTALARAAGLPLDDWQDDIVTDGCRTTGGRWSAFEVGVFAPRQNGKTFVVPARVLAGALLYGDKLIVYSAHEYRTARETWRLVHDVCTSEAVRPYVRRIMTGAGVEVVEFTSGCRFILMARTRTSGRGFSPDCLMLDEAMYLSEDVVAALMPSLSARPNPQLWYLSSAGTYESKVLLGVRTRGHNPATTGLCYREWHGSETDDPADRRVWAATNPTYNRRLPPAAVAREHMSLPRQVFMRERLGVWSQTLVPTVLDEQTVNDLTVDPPPPPSDGRPVGWGVDVAWDRTGAAIAAAFRGDDGVPVLVLVEARPGAGWLPERLADLDGRYRIDAAAYDHRGGITDLMDRAARDHDVTIAPMRYADYPGACAGLAQRVTDRAVRFGRAPALVGDALHATATPVGGGWVWARKVATPPTHLVAATAALWALDRGGGASAVAVY